MGGYEKLVRDGKVAVIVSYGFGAGWYSWNQNDGGARLLFDRRLVEAVLGESGEAVADVAAEIAPDAYAGGLDDAAVAWVPEGAIFRIDECDGSESLVIQADDEWLIA